MFTIVGRTEEEFSIALQVGNSVSDGRDDGGVCGDVVGSLRGKVAGGHYDVLEQCLDYIAISVLTRAELLNEVTRITGIEVF